MATPELTPELGHHERNYVYAIALRYVRDETAADDVAQEAMLLAHRHRKKFQGRSKYSTWLYRIAATTALMYLRKQKRLGRERPISSLADEDGRLPPLVDPTRPVHAKLAALEAIRAVDHELADLGTTSRDLFWSKFLLGQTEREMAENTGMSVSAVKSRTFRARARVKAVFPEKVAA